MNELKIGDTVRGETWRDIGIITKIIKIEKECYCDIYWIKQKRFLKEYRYTNKIVDLIEKIN